MLRPKLLRRQNAWPRFVGVGDEPTVVEVLPNTGNGKLVFHWFAVRRGAAGNQLLRDQHAVLAETHELGRSLLRVDDIALALIPPFKLLLTQAIESADDAPVNDEDQGGGVQVRGEETVGVMCVGGKLLLVNQRQDFPLGGRLRLRDAGQRQAEKKDDIDASFHRRGLYAKPTRNTTREQDRLADRTHEDFAGARRCRAASDILISRIRFENSWPGFLIGWRRSGFDLQHFRESYAPRQEVSIQRPSKYS